MADVLCPTCGKPNPVELESCQFCGGRLKPKDSQSIQVGQEPINLGTDKLENIKPAGDESAAGDSPDQSLPLSPVPAAIPDVSDDQSDWLSGLGKAAAEDNEEIPDWMGRLRGDKADAPTPTSEPEMGPASNETNSPSAETGDANKPLQSNIEPPAEETQSSQPQAPVFEQSPLEITGQEGLPDWLQSLQPKPADGEEAPAASQGEGETLDWLDSLRAHSAASENPEQIVPAQSNDDKSMPDWLAGLPGIPEAHPIATGPTESAAPTENLPDWLNQLKGENIDLESTQSGNTGPSGNTPSTPDWLSDLGSTPGTNETSGGENIPEWLSGYEEKDSPDSGKPTAMSGGEQQPPGTAHEEIPDWISRFQAGTNAAAAQESNQEQFEVTPEPPANKEENGSLPDWLAGIRPTTTEPSEGTPARILNKDESTTPVDENEPVFSMETPEWLSKINPEQAAEKPPQGAAEGSALENPEVSELPSWVQAMRPVESVVAEVKPDLEEGAGITEQSGPLAGLSGVLPVGPGLGQLSKPPAYSVKIQATDDQQRYAAVLERLVTSETQPQAIKSTHIASNQLWRWLISFVLILAVGFPLVTNIPISQATELKPPEMLSTFTLIGSLPPSAPVLVVFDYEPALSGEMEAAATPLIDHLLLQGPRLALISTSPTGPALAERFLTDTNDSPLVAGHNYQAGKQYVDLGYLAGGPSGIQYFAMSPADAAPYTLDGQQAWQLPPLQGVQKLSDFTAILILTDNADSGRAWIEQTGSAIGNTPLLMVISAQAEPMLLPYYDSGQIKGLVTGLAGGEAYAQAYIRPDGKTGPAQHYWGSFSVGVLIAEILIVLGALWNAISGWRYRRTKAGEEA